MFLDRLYFEEVFSLVKVSEMIRADESKRVSMAKDFAKEMFENFDSMKTQEQKDLIEMILDDVRSLQDSVYSIN